MVIDSFSSLPGESDLKQELLEPMLGTQPGSEIDLEFHPAAFNSRIATRRMRKVLDPKPRVPNVPPLSTTKQEVL